MNALRVTTSAENFARTVRPILSTDLGGFNVVRRDGRRVCVEIYPARGGAFIRRVADLIKNANGSKVQTVTDCEIEVI